MSNSGTTSKQILVVEDNDTAAQVLVRLLQSEGYWAQRARDGEEALTLVAEFAFDLILLDLNMPRLNGFEVCRRLKQTPATRLIPIIIITGGEDSEARLKAWELGADDFLTKPFQTVEVAVRCRSLLRIRSLIADLDTAQTVVMALARAVEAKSAYTQGHAERVTHYAAALGESLGLSESERDLLRRGAGLHDIGKISIPDAILNKPAALTAEEYDIVKQHPVAGVRIVEPLRSAQDVIPLIRWHHERLDGRGYPDGLMGRAIPLLPRLIAVVDVFDALSSARPYRPALSRAECLKIMTANAAEGGLDPELVRHFTKVLLQDHPVPSAISLREEGRNRT